MKTRFLLLAALVLSLNPSFSLIKDKIVAFVGNKGIITSYQVDIYSRQLKKAYDEAKVAMPTPEVLKSQATEQLIMENIQLQLAQRLNLTTDDYEVDNVLQSIIAQQGLSLAQFKANLQSYGIDFADFRKELKNQIILKLLKQRQVDSRVVVTDNELNLIMQSAAYRNQVEYNLDSIIFPLPQNATDQGQIKQIQQAAQEAYQQLQEGIPFDQVKASYSVTPQAGNLGWQNSAILPKEVLSAIDKLTTTAYTQVVSLPPVGFFIFELKGKRTPETVNSSLKQYLLREITLPASASSEIQLLSAQLQKSGNNRTLQDNIFRTYNQKYPFVGSVSPDGQLKWTYLDDLKLTSSFATLTKGEISKAVINQNSWQIFQILDIKAETQASLFEHNREKLRQQLAAAKAQTLYLEWLRDLKASTYVKYNNS